MQFTVTVYDLYTGAAVVGATVNLIDSAGANQSGVTNGAGQIVFTYTNPGAGVTRTVVLKPSLAGYYGSEKAFTVISSTGNISHAAYLTQSVGQIHNVDIAAPLPQLIEYYNAEISRVNIAAPLPALSDFFRGALHRATIQEILAYTFKVQTNSGVPVEESLVTVVLPDGRTYRGLTAADGTIKMPFSSGTSVTATFDDYTPFTVNNFVFTNTATPIILTITIPPCINRNPSNPYNFIRFYKSEGVAFPFPDPSTILYCEDFDDNLPNAYNKTKCIKYKPLLVVGEEYSFYMNLLIPSTFASFANWKAALIKDNAIVYNNLAVLQQDFIDGTNFNIFFTFDMPAVSDGNYQIMIYNPIDAPVYYFSNELQVVQNDSDYADYSVLMKYRNSQNLYNYRYENISDFYNVVRIHLNKIDIQSEGEFKSYKPVSTGRRRNLQTSLDKVVKLEAYYFDDDAHEAMMVLMAHDEIYINNRRYVSKGNYQAQINPQLNVNKGIAEFYDDRFSTINNYC